ncbi:MAG: hypothetical protein Q9221_006217 [Calogaya cf. arnoldii]
MTTPQKRPSSSEQEAEPKKKPKLPDAKPFFPYDRMVIILVGPQSERFEVHQKLVCHYPFFKAAYEGAFQESGGVLKLPEQDPDIVRFFIYWLYASKLTGYYYPPSEGNQLDVDGSEAKYFRELACYRDTPFHSLINLYILAEYIYIPRLKDDIINQLVCTYSCTHRLRRGLCESGMNWFWGWTSEERPDWASDVVTSINTAWNSLPKDSHLCKLLVVLFCDNGMMRGHPDQEPHYDQLAPSFLCNAFAVVQARLDCTSKLGMRNTTSWEKPGVLCTFHNHDGISCRFHDEKMAKKKAKKQPAAQP